jgi:hypothetical protein
VTPAQVAGKVAFFTCDVSLQGAGGVLATTIVAEGSVSLRGAGTSFSPTGAGLVAMSTKKDVNIAGAGLRISGGVEASTGTILISGSGNTLGCHVVGNQISISGSSNTVSKC